ncbi:hypothetical protein AB6896_01830 [Rahnella inusitata]|uniref:hypothetical protein n=1 Tax=Rahnella inusitata TaxID=58169 RepID=UPI0039BDC001
MNAIKPFIALLIPIVLVGCDANSEAPFGTRWNEGQQQYEFSSLPSFQSLPQNDGGLLLYTTTPPLGKIGTGEYRFYFKSNKLKKIIYRSYDITGIDSENAAKSEYERLKLVMTKEYGEPAVVKQSVYSNGFAFFPCVSNKECGQWSSEFIGQSTKATLKITMGNNGHGYTQDRSSGSVAIEFSPK